MVHNSPYLVQVEAEFFNHVMEDDHMPITPFGKQVRKYRIDADLTLSDMAEELDVSPAYLSAIETGRKPLNDELVRRCVGYFRKHNIDAAVLLRLADLRRKQVSVAHLEEDERAAFAALARKLPELPKSKRRQLLEKIIEEE